MMLLVIHITVEEFLPILHYNVASVPQGSLAFVMHSSLMIPSQHSNQVEVWTLTGPLQHLESFLFQTFCCRFAAVFGIIVLLMSQYQPSFSCRTDGLTFDSRILWYPEEFMVDSMTARCPGPVAVKQVQIFTPPPLY